MANRFPLIVNPDTKEIQEISQNDNLDLTGNGVYAGGSLGSNGQVLTTNGTTVEWRTLTGGGGGGGGIDSDTTYIVEAEDQADGASLNLVAGGSGVGTIRIKFQDNDQLQFDTIDNLTISPSIKAGSIENTQLEEDGLDITINGQQNRYTLGSNVVIPVYGDVFRTATQEISNKTLKDCNISLAPGDGNTMVSIPNSALLNKGLTINGSFYELGDTVNIVGGGGGADTNTTYVLSADTVQTTNAAVRLTGSDAAIYDVTFVAGDRIALSVANNNTITITNTEVNTDTDTTYSTSTDTLQSGNLSVGARINLNGGGTGSGASTVDRLNLRNGTGVTVNSISDEDIQFSIGQDVSTSSNVEFNSLTVKGSLTVEGATTYVDTTNLVVTDKTIIIADGVTNSANANGAGLNIGTSNINLTYEDASFAWLSTANWNLAPTKTYKIGGTDVLSSTRVLGKAMPIGDIVGTLDTQTLSNKTLNSPIISEIINTGTVYFPAPNIADTLVGRATQDTLTNKQISGSTNTITNIGNSSLVNSGITINNNLVSLGESITVTATDSYTDEKAQDTVAGMITNAVHSGISWVYDDTTGTLSATVTAGGGGGATTLSGLTDTDLTTTTPLNGDILGYNGTEWVPTQFVIPPYSTTGNFEGNFVGNVTAGVVTSDSFVKNGGTSTEYLMADGSVSSAPITTTSTTGNFSGTFTGNLDAGVVTSDSFVKNGGTSSEFLMADGSVSTPTAITAIGCITLNGTSPTWSGTAGYTVSGAQPGGAGTDYEITLTFPTAYSARTEYIIQTTYDSTNYVSGNGASIGVARGTASVVFTPRRWDENPLSLGEIMVTIIEL